MKILKRLSFVFLIINSLLRAEPSQYLEKNRVFIELSSLFSLESYLGYEYRLNDLIGLSAGINGGVHVLTRALQTQSHIGPRAQVSFYFTPLTDRHQFYLAPALELAYGHSGTYSEERKERIAIHAITMRVLSFAGYRYNFSFPMTFDIGLGAEPFAMTTFSENELTRTPLFYPFVPVFLHFGLGYRF